MSRRAGGEKRLPGGGGRAHAQAGQQKCRYVSPEAVSAKAAGLRLRSLEHRQLEPSPAPTAPHSGGDTRGRSRVAPAQPSSAEGFGGGMAWESATC